MTNKAPGVIFRDRDFPNEELVTLLSDFLAHNQNYLIQV